MNILQALLAFLSLQTCWARLSVRRFELCTPENPLQFVGNFTKGSDGKDYFDADIIIPFALDERYGLAIEAEQSMNGKTFRKVFRVRDKYFCKSIKKLLGDFWISMADAVGINGRVCPIAPGHYGGSRIELDFDHPILNAIPFGIIRGTSKLVDNETKKAVICFLVEVEK